MTLPVPTGKQPVEPARSLHAPSVWQFSLTALALALAWNLALALAGLAATSGLAPGSRPQLSALTLFPMAAVSFFIGLLLLPPALLALRRLLGKPATAGPAWLSRLHPWPFLLAWPLLLALGGWVLQRPGLSWLAWPPVHILVVGIPVWFILALAGRGLPLGSLQRQWGAFSAGLALAPLVIMFLEAMASIAMIFVVAGILSGQPEVVQQLERLSRGLRGPGLSPQEVLHKLAPLLLKPGIVYLGLAFIAGVVPLIEEIFKPLGVWLLMGRRLSPAAGFGLGALSGAGYALIESLLLAGPNEGWMLVAGARVGTAAVHIFTTALVGGALAQAWRSGGYLRLALAYLAAVMVHGLWNALSALTAFSEAAQLADMPGLEGRLESLVQVTPVGLAFLALGSLVALLISRRSLAASWQRQQVRRSQRSSLQDAHLAAEPVHDYEI